jgi:hypothetical protein
MEISAEVQTIWSLPLFASLKAIVDRTAKPMSPADWASFATDLEIQLSAKIKPGDGSPGEKKSWEQNRARQIPVRSLCKNWFEKFSRNRMV